jgi:hypothetical protein
MTTRKLDPFTMGEKAEKAFRLDEFGDAEGDLGLEPQRLLSLVGSGQRSDSSANESALPSGLHVG